MNIPVLIGAQCVMKLIGNLHDPSSISETHIVDRKN